ncbi:MAG: 2-amino-4-hydroxy-6-hydroxymethyldihydropteridine diphosphokinase [Chitinophagia bacterium]|jgi:2-amino-4-hydroxy-6-hydroxymethyldihydropteridine diphosphokinase
MSEAYLLIGGNLGDRELNLEQSRIIINKSCGRIKLQSKIYETAAWGSIPQPDYLNQVLLIETDLDPYELMRALLKTELELGRVRNEKFGARTIDIDILYFDDTIIDADELTIPHPRISERRFVLTPLAEIAEEMTDPKNRKNIKTMLLECKDELSVSEFSPNVHKNDL